MAESAEVHYRHGDPCRTLEEAGFAPGQARALLDVIADRESRLVTSESMTAYENDVAILKSGLGGLKERMASVEGRIDGLVMVVEGLRQEVRERNEALRLELTAKFEALEARVDRRMSALDGRIGSLEAKMDGRIGSLEGKMDGVLGELRTLKWTLGILVGVVAAVGAPVAAALVRLAFFAYFPWVRRRPRRLSEKRRARPKASLRRRTR